VETVEHQRLASLGLPSKPLFDMLVVVMKTDADGRRMSRPAQLSIAGLVGRKERYFSVSPDLLMDMSMV
jgi:hypothetical protein